MRPSVGTPTEKPAELITAEAAAPEHSGPRWPILLAAIALAALVVAVFHPIVGFEFMDLDVPGQVLENPHIRGLTVENLKHIFTTRGTTISYYPLRMLTFAIDHQFWGLDPRGFKLTNILLHLANVLLVFGLVLRLCRHAVAAGGPLQVGWDLFAATFAAGLFAVHPVVVEPVTWVAGREELLMTLGALGCFHCHLTARRLEESGGKSRRRLAWYAAETLCCLAACLSNVVAAVIPLLITAWDALTFQPSRSWRILYRTSLLWVIALATLASKSRGYQGITVPVPEVFSIEWLLVIPNVYWLNLKALAWPGGLTIHYAWPSPQGFLHPEVILGVLAIGLTCAAFWELRRRKLILFGLAWFCLALAPAAQILPNHIARADRFLYLPLVGLAVAVGMGLRLLRITLKGPNAMAGVMALGLLGMVAASVTSARQVQTWRTRLSLWEHCIKVAPDNPTGYSCLARNLSQAGEFRQALDHYEAVMRMSPIDADTLADFSWFLATCDDRQLRDYDRALQLADWARASTGGADLRILHKFAIVHCSIAEDLAAAGEFRRAVRHYDKAIQADPAFDLPLFNLALLLTTCPDANLREPDRAVRLAERACELMDEPGAHRLAILAGAYAEAGRFHVATLTIERAVSLAEAAGDSGMSAELRQMLGFYRKGVRFEPPGE